MDARPPVILALRMILSMEVLLLSGQALRERIEHELSENPALAMLDTEPTSAPAEASRGEPDAIVERAHGGDYNVRPLDQWTGLVHLSDRYSDLSDKESVSKALFRRKAEQAMWLVHALEVRRLTLEKVIGAIVRHQRAFLDKGVAFLEPCPMQLIADEAGVHVTTASRAVEAKWLQTPHGVFPVRRFVTDPRQIGE